jgi:hypothetical protein
MARIFYTRPELLATQLAVVTEAAILLQNAFEGATLTLVAKDAAHLRYTASQTQSVALLYSPVIKLREACPHFISFGMKQASGNLTFRDWKYVLAN